MLKFIETWVSWLLINFFVFLKTNSKKTPIFLILRKTNRRTAIFCTNNKHIQHVQNIGQYLADEKT